MIEQWARNRPAGGDGPGVLGRRIAPAHGFSKGCRIRGLYLLCFNECL